MTFSVTKSFVYIRLFQLYFFISPKATKIFDIDADSYPNLQCVSYRIFPIYIISTPESNYYNLIFKRTKSITNIFHVSSSYSLNHFFKTCWFMFFPVTKEWNCHATLSTTRIVPILLWNKRIFLAVLLTDFSVLFAV